MDRVVEVALQSFIGMVNDIVHPLDKATCVDLFETLWSGGETFSREEVVLWLRRQGWTDARAERVGVVAQKVLEGRRQKCIRRVYGPEALADWRKMSIEHQSKHLD